MSICVDYFFNHGYELSALAKEINGWIGCSLSPYEGNREDLFSRFLGSYWIGLMRIFRNLMKISMRAERYSGSNQVLTRALVESGN
jgi:hypothetical protein